MSIKNTSTGLRKQGDKYQVVFRGKYIGLVDSQDDGREILNLLKAKILKSKTCGKREGAGRPKKAGENTAE